MGVIFVPAEVAKQGVSRAEVLKSEKSEVKSQATPFRIIKDDSKATQEGLY